MNYKFKCTECEYDTIKQISYINRDNIFQCDKCNGDMRRVFECTKTIVIPDIFSNQLEDWEVLPSDMSGLEPAK